MTSTGVIHLAADSRIIGAFDGIWTNDPAGNGITVRKQLDAPVTHAASMSRSHITSTAASAPGTDASPVTNTDPVPATSPDVHAEMMWLCAMSEYYVWHTDGINWWTETQYRLTSCDSGGGGGVGGCSVSGLEPRSMSGRPVTALTICDGDSGGPGGGYGNGSNNQIADPTLHADVDDGKGNATAKLLSAQCQAMIRMNTNAAGISLWDVLTSYSSDPGTYLDTKITFVKGDGTIDIGSGNVPCSVYGTEAWVSVPGVHTVDVCGSFHTLTTGMRGVTVIHEMLHTLGLPEYPYGYTSQQIQQMVVDWCGAQ